MALAIDSVDGHGLSNEVRHKLLPKKTKVLEYIHYYTCMVTVLLSTYIDLFIIPNFLLILCLALRMLVKITANYCIAGNF